MANKNKGFPEGWGNNSEDDDYGFVDDINDEDDDDSESVWRNSSSPFKKSEPVTFPDTDNKTVISDSDNDEADTDLVHKIPVQDVRQPENTPAPTVNIPQSQGYVTQKTSPIIIIVIIILVLVIGVLGGMFFMMNRDKPVVSENSFPADENSSVSDIEEPTDSKDSADMEEITTASETNVLTVTAAETATIVASTEMSVNKTDDNEKIPTISAYIEEKSYYPIADGTDFILHTSGNYSYYHYSNPILK